jgi:hypothetical protein
LIQLGVPVGSRNDFIPDAFTGKEEALAIPFSDFSSFGDSLVDVGSLSEHSIMAEPSLLKCCSMNDLISDPEILFICGAINQLTLLKAYLELMTQRCGRRSEGVIYRLKRNFK